MIKDAVLSRKEIIIVALLTTIIFLTHTIYVKDTGIICILDDEYGYWANAAYFSGLDWSATVSKIPYYSYGYSLLLVPLFKIFNNTTTMYQVAVIMNGIMVSISFLLCYDIARKLLKDYNKTVLLSISFLISMYPTYIAYSHLGWGECLLMLLFWFLTWCFVDLNTKSSIYRFLAIGILSSYIYIVHQRSLGILVASIIVISLMKILKKITVKQLLFAILPIIIVMTVHMVIKDNIQSNLWLSGSGIAINDFSGQTDKLNQLLSVNGLISFMKILTGQLFYMAAASLMMVYFGIFELIQKPFGICNRNYKDDNTVFLYLFLFVSIVLTITISAVSVINPGRIDQIIYGRYNEIIMGPLMLLGFVKLLNMDKLSNKQYIIIIISFLVHTAITYYIMKTSGLDLININIIHTILLNFMNTKLSILLPGIISVILFRLIWISFKNKNRNFIIITMTVISIAYCCFGVLSAMTIAEQQQAMLEILKVTEKINANEEDLPVYFLFENPDEYEAVQWNGMSIRDRSVSDCYQFILKDKKIIPINLEDLELTTVDKFVITTDNINIDFLQDKYVLYGSDNGSYLFKTK